MTFTKAIISGFNNYINFSTRSSRSEYWYWVLFVFIASLVLYVLSVPLFYAFHSSFVLELFGLIIFLPSLAVGIRRLHDINKSGWFIIIKFIPIIGWIIFIIMACIAGDKKTNRFGPVPSNN